MSVAPSIFKRHLSNTLKATTMPLRVLIVGAGICGPVLANLLQRSNAPYDITVVEQASSLRLSGQQLDLKAQGYPIVKKMGLLEAVRAHCVGETGAQMVDAGGAVIARFGVNDAEADESRFLTHEYEIMRGDLVKVFYEASIEQRAKLDAAGRPGALAYEFGKTITALWQEEDGRDGVDVTFSDGQKQRYDLVVGADGQGSRTRRLLFGQQASEEAFRSLDVHAAFYSIPRGEGEGSDAKLYLGPGGRGVITRTGDLPVTQVYLFAMNKQHAEALKAASKESPDTRRSLWMDLFRDAGWQSERLTGAAATADDFHAWELAQIRLKQLHSGRVALLGDAGYCPTVFTGMGTTASLVGAWVLAGELARHGNDVSRALQAYDEVMRSPIEEWRQMLATVSTIRPPSSRLGVWLLHNAIWAFSSLSSLGTKLGIGFGQLSPLRPTEKEGAWRLPEYPELNPES